MRTWPSIGAYLEDHPPLIDAIGLPGAPSESTLRETLERIPDDALRAFMRDWSEAMHFRGRKTWITDVKAYHGEKVRYNPKTRRRSKVIPFSLFNHARAKKKAREAGDGTKTKPKTDPDPDFVELTRNFYHFAATIDYRSDFILSVAADDASVGETTLFRRCMPLFPGNIAVQSWLMDRGYDSKEIHAFASKVARHDCIRPKADAQHRAKDCPERARIVRRMYTMGLAERIKENPKPQGLRGKEKIAVRKKIMELGFSKWSRKTGYRKRTQIERVFAAMQTRFGDWCRSRKPANRVKDLYVDVFAWNILLMADHRPSGR